MLFVLAGSEGFEPSLAVLETDVLAVDTKTQGEALLRLELLAPLDNLLGVAVRPDRSNQWFRIVDQQGFEPWCQLVPFRVLPAGRNRPSP